MISRTIRIGVIALLITFSLFEFLYRYDNKYTHVQPRGCDGVMVLTEEDIKDPVFLIDGWKLSVDGGPEIDTYIGQYSNYSYVPGAESAFGTGVYRLKLRYLGSPRILTMELPEIFTEYTLKVDGQIVAETGSGIAVSFLVDDDTSLEWTITNSSHYYSGLYYPPALGTLEDICRMEFFRNLFYGIICVSAVTVALSSGYLWLRREKGGIYFHYAVLCVAFAFSNLYTLFWQLDIVSPLSYAIEDGSRLIVWMEALVIALESAGLWNRLKKIYPVFIGLAGACAVIVAVVIPQFPELIVVHGAAMDFSAVFLWICLAAATGIGISKAQNQETMYSLAGCCALGASLFSNLMDSNSFEPIYTGWQWEWAGFFMVLIFGKLILCHHDKLMKENVELTKHLDETVEKRTADLVAVINERKRFFSDMAHNLKAPIAAIHGFISLIQEGNVGVDDELLGYIALIENENMEMRRRVQALNTINAFDKIEEPQRWLSVNKILSDVEEYNGPEAEAVGVHFIVTGLERDVFFKAQKEKIMVLFENLIYNALSFTEFDDKISLTALFIGGRVTIYVEDTGAGIPEENIPHIFDRFYVGRENKREGSGLGLYIAKLTVEEIGGTITAESRLGEGTTFIITIPAVLELPDEETETE